MSLSVQRVGPVVLEAPVQPCLGHIPTAHLSGWGEVTADLVEEVHWNFSCVFLLEGEEGLRERRG